MAVKLLHEEITKRVIGAGMDVFNSIGSGWDEWDYHRAMLKALASRGVKAESHLRGTLMHRGQCVDRFELDILVEDKVILELKHIREGFAPEHYVQLISYLKFWKKDLVYGELKLGERPVDSFVIGSSLVVKATSLPENTSSIDLTRLQSCMAQLGVPCGLLANFGRSALLLRAVKIK